MMRETISKRQSHGGVFAAALKAARQRKRWSQRELSARSHMTQAHISRIENGEVDLQLSSLVELARTLDLEVRLVPRTALTAVDATIRASEERLSDQEIRRVFANVRRQAERLGEAYPGPELRDLVSIAGDLEQLTPRLQMPMLPGRVEKAVRELMMLPGDDLRAGSATRRVRNTLEVLRHFRSFILHSRQDERPAYVLDDETF